jgi:PAS domain S-box-containing protein
VLFRQWLPWLIAIPVALGLLRVLGERKGLYDTAFGTGILVTAVVVFFSVLLWRTAIRLSRLAREQAAVQQRLAHAASIPELNPSPIFETDLEGKVTYANAAVQKLFPNILESGAIAPILAGWEAVIAGYPSGTEPVMVREFEAAGRTYQQTIYFPRELRLVRSYCTDITERKRAEGQLQRDVSALTRMHALSDRVLNAPGHEALLQEVVDAAVAIMGAQRGTLQLLEGDSLRIVAHHGHERPFLEFFASAETRASACGEAMCRRERVLVEDVEKSPLFTGTPSLPVLRAAGVRAIQSTPLVGRSNELFGILTTQWSVPHSPSRHDLGLLDLLARQAADLIGHAWAEEVQRQLAAIVETSEDAILSETLEGIVLTWNAGAEGMFGYTAREIIGQPVRLLLPPERLDEENEILERLKQGRPVKQLETVRVAKGGRPIDVSISTSPLRDSSGNLTGASKIMRDIGERKRAEEALIRHEKLVSVGRMAATIAHEINNPLAAVGNLLYLASSVEDLPAPARQYLETADEELRRVAHIARQSLGFYRDTNAPAPTPIAALLDSTLDLLKSKVRAKQAVVRKQWDGDVQVTAVAGELRQVFSNLLANSLDAIEDNGTVALRVSADVPSRCGRRQVRILVADNGGGITADTRQHLFEPFVTTKGTLGTGLGLWVSQQIVKKHGGTIRVRSRTEGSRKGTVVSVVLPMEGAIRARGQAADA